MNVQEHEALTVPGYSPDVLVNSPQLDSHFSSNETLQMPTPPIRQPVIERIHLRYIDGIRALAALYVVISHMWLEVWPVFYQQSPTGLLYTLTGWMAYAHIAVSVFIVVSGFSLTIPVVRNGGRFKQGWNGFLVRRARRILPTYYLAIAFCLVLIWTCVGQKTGTHWDLSVPITWRDVWLHIFLIQDATSTAGINHAFWSIGVEWRIYLLFPLLVVIQRRFGVGATLAVGICSSAIYLLYFERLTPNNPWLSDGFSGIPFTYFTLFILGMVGATIAFSANSRLRIMCAAIPWHLLTVVSGISLILIIYWWRTGGILALSFAQWACIDLVTGVFATSLLVLGVQSKESLVHTICGWRPLAFVGTFAYSIYLIHAPLIQVVWQYLLHPLHLGGTATLCGLLLVGIPFIVGVSYLFFWIGERPFITKEKTVTA